MAHALDVALAGKDDALRDFLTRHSGLPGVRANLRLAASFADLCALRGAAVDRVLAKLLVLDAERAPGGSPFEFLPMCAVLATGARAAKDQRHMRAALAQLHAAADDLRFRVRACVSDALARVGEAHGGEVLPLLDDWMDGYFHAAAVLTALGESSWLSQLHDAGPVVDRLNEAFDLALRAERAASRYPGYKALVEVLGVAPALVAGRFGVPVFDALVAWSRTDIPILREAIAKNLQNKQLRGRHRSEIDRVRDALDSSAPVRRDPTTDVGPTRGRGRKRR